MASSSASAQGSQILYLTRTSEVYATETDVFTIDIKVTQKLFDINKSSTVETVLNNHDQI